VGRHGAGAPVAVEPRRLMSSNCAHWHTSSNGAQSKASKTMFELTLSRAVARNSEWRRCNDRGRRYERGEDPAEGRHGAGVPVAMEHRWRHSSACSHWHSRPDGVPSRASKTMFQCSSLGLPSIVFAYIGPKHSSLPSYLPERDWRAPVEAPAGHPLRLHMG